MLSLITIFRLNSIDLTRLCCCVRLHMMIFLSNDAFANYKVTQTLKCFDFLKDSLGCRLRCY